MCGLALLTLRVSRVLPGVGWVFLFGLALLTLRVSRVLLGVGVGFLVWFGLADAAGFQVFAGVGVSSRFDLWEGGGLDLYILVFG